MKTVILQRIVPNYRKPLYEVLYRKLGWIVVCADQAPPGTSEMELVRNEPWIRTLPFRFLSTANPYLCHVPVGRLMESEKPDLVIAEFSMSMSSSWSLPYLRRTGQLRRLAFSSHGFNMERGTVSLSGRLAASLRLPLMAAADANICYSKEGASWLEEKIPSEKVFVALNTIDVSPLRVLRQRIPPHASATKGPHLLSVGRMTPDKEMPKLVAVLREVLKSLPEASLTIVGNGPDYQRAKSEAAELLDVSVFLPGTIYDEATLASYFNEADIFVYAGAVGLGVNHALAYDLPVMAFSRHPNGPHHHPEIEYVVDDVTGWRISPPEPGEMARALVEHFSHGQSPREQLSTKIRAFVDKNLTIETYADALEKISQLLRERD